MFFFHYIAHLIFLSTGNYVWICLLEKCHHRRMHDTSFCSCLNDGSLSIFYEGSERRIIISIEFTVFIQVSVIIAICFRKIWQNWFHWRIIVRIDDIDGFDILAGENHQFAWNEHARLCLRIRIQKAFDTVKHSTLFEKFAELPLPAHIHNWLADFFGIRLH